MGGFLLFLLYGLSFDSPFDATPRMGDLMIKDDDKTEEEDVCDH